MPRRRGCPCRCRRRRYQAHTQPQYGHLSELQRTLKAIRKPYLSTDVPPPLSRRARNDGGDELKRYEGSKYLSERERDEIDVRTKMILRRCRERVGDLEAEEKGACSKGGGSVADVQHDKPRRHHQRQPSSSSSLR